MIALHGRAGWLLLAGLRPSGSAVATSLAGLHLSLLGDLQRVVNFDAKVSDCALQLGMPKQELNGSEVLRTLVNQRCLGSLHRLVP